MNEISQIIKEKAPIILREIQKANSILLHCHPSPDTDSVCSVLAMKYALEKMGKKVTAISGDSDIPQAYMHFLGASTIMQKNFFEIDIKEFDLFLILDSAAPSMISRRGDMKFPLEIKTINIDHHQTNTNYADINLIDLNSQALAFTLFQLFHEWNVELTHDISINLFTGMYSDTGGFKYEGTDHRMFEAIGVLTKIAPDFPQAIFILENSNEKDVVYFERAALNSIETFLDENVVIASVSQEDVKEKNISLNAVSGSEIGNLLKSVIGWNVSVLMTEIEKDKIKISFRTRDSDRFDVSRIATEFGGGGHKAASGALLNNTSLEEAKRVVVSKAKELYKF
ncbi:MAG: DHH family phosphoesterase [Candidatus Paceibacterota bacterium]|jgi:phosphoesterase RecJ-like protein